jgi:hypothetical protein
MSALIRAGFLAHYLQVAGRLGLDAQPLLKKFGLTKAMLADPERPVSSRAAIRLLEQSARASRCPTFGLHMAELRELSDFGVVSLLLAHQGTLRDAIETLIYYRHLLNESIVVRIERAGKKVIVREEVVADGVGPSIQATELALGTLSRMCGSLLGASWQPRSVNFTHDAPADLGLHRRIFGADLEFGGSFNGIVCRSVDFDLPNPIADPAMARLAQRLLRGLPAANERSVVLEVRRAIYLMLPIGRATIQQVAQQLGMHVRTLQRELGGGWQRLFPHGQRSTPRACYPLYGDTTVRLKAEQIQLVSAVIGFDLRWIRLQGA